MHYGEWAARVRAVDRPWANQVPLALRNGGEPLVVSPHKHASLLPFSARYAAQHTVCLSRCRSGARPTARNISRRSSPRTPGCLSRNGCWTPRPIPTRLGYGALSAPNCTRVIGAVFGTCYKRQRALVIEQGNVLEAVQGVVWDCRLWKHGRPAVPHDFSEAPSTELNNAAIGSEAELHRWPDQRLVGMLVDGVRYQADLRLQFVFGPHLTSLPVDFLSVEKEPKRLLKQSFIGLHRLELELIQPI